MEISKILDELLEKEKELSVTDFKYRGIELWRLFRFDCRRGYIQKYNPEYSNKTRRMSKMRFLCFMLYQLLKSFVQLLGLLLRGEQVENVVFAFPRLQVFKDTWVIDKYTDPVIENSVLNKNVLVLQQSGRTYLGRKQRFKQQRVIQMESIRLIANCGALFCLLLLPLCPVAKELYRLWRRTSDTFGLSWRTFLQWCYMYHSFIIQSFIYKCLFKRLSCRNIFVVNRLVFISQIHAAHKLGILAYEFQHGVTQGKTELYSGEYNSLLDPDYFLNFSQIWRGPQFGMPLDKQINIGWAYRKFVEEAFQDNKYSSDTILVISSPEITEKLIYTIIELAGNNADVVFHIRCHPQESIPDVLKTKIEEYSNIEIADNSIDSYIALFSYQHVLGENSSVLYEALDMGKNVGRFSYNGFVPVRTSDKLEEAFFYLQSSKELHEFMHRDHPVVERKGYEDFNSGVFNDLISIR